MVQLRSALLGVHEKDIVDDEAGCCLRTGDWPLCAATIALPYCQSRTAVALHVSRHVPSCVLRVFLQVLTNNVQANCV